MAIELRNTGISVVGDVPWGTHFCHFYETKLDLLDTLVPYFKAGLENREFCVWVVSNFELITVAEAKGALAQAVPDLDQRLADGNIEILNGLEWYLGENAFNLERVTSGWDAKLKLALARGYEGMRVSGDTLWPTEKDWKDFCAYEKQLNDSITDQPMNVLCTYPLAKSGAGEVLDVVQAHQFAIARRQGEWEVIETPELMHAKAEIKRLNEELEQRVIERTNNLRVVNEELRNEIAERKRSDDDLRRQKEILQQIFDHIPVMINFVGADGRIKLVNREWERTLGWSLEEIRQQNVDIFAECYPDPEYRQQVLKFVAKAKGEWFDFKTRVRDGRVMDTTWVRVHLSDGTSIGIGQDITERKRAEDVLRRSEDHLRLVIDTIPTMAWSLRPDGVLDFVNQRWLDYTGLSFKQAIEEPTRTVHPEDLSRVMEKWLAVKATSEAYEDEMRMQRADGEYRWFLVRIAPLLDEQGNILKRYGVSIDIEDRKQAEEKLRQSERQLVEAQRLAHVGGWDWDLRSNTVTWSDELYRIFGLPRGQIKIAGDATPFIHPEDRDLVLSTVKRAISNKEPYCFYYRVLKPDGTERIIQSRGSVLSDEHGEPIRVFGASQDVTEFKRAEEKLKATTEQLRALSASVQSAREAEAARISREIHDELGSALTSLKLDLELIRRKGFSATNDADLSRFQEKIKTMMQLIDQTVDIVRKISSELRPSVLDDIGLVAAMRWQAQQFEAQAGIVCHYDFSVEDVDLDSQQATAVFRVFQEALTNVVRHAEASRIDITLDKQNDDLVLTIRDNGRGITADEKSDRRSLGLLGMQERVNLIGGSIHVTGVEGQGTIIMVRVSRSGQDHSAQTETSTIA
jgi:PAS domain S-box-containing protein